MGTVHPESFNNLEENPGILRRDHRFKEFPLAMPASKIAVITRDTDRRKSVFMEGKGMVLVRNRSGDGEGKLMAKMELSEPESLSLEFC